MQCHLGARALAPLVVALLTLIGATAVGETFDSTVILDAGQPVYGLVWDAIDPSHPGEELAYLAADGSVTECIPGEIPWQENPVVPAGDVVRGMWDRPTLDAGDVSGSHTHREIVVQACYQLIVAHNTGSSWGQEVLFDWTGATCNSWGARAGDYDPSHEGEEILLIVEGVFDRSAGHVYSKTAGVWRDTLVYSAEVGMDSAAGEFNSDHDGFETCLPTEMWPAYEIHPPEPVRASGRELWPSQVMWYDYDHAAWVVEIGDVDPANPGNEVVYGTRYSNSITVSRYVPGVGHGLEVAFTGSASGAFMNMWDIALGDVLPDTPEDEIVGVDDSGNVYLVRRNDAMEWVGETIWTDPGGGLYAVVTCDVDDGVDGDEILVAGVSGELTLLTRDTTSVPGVDSGHVAPAMLGIAPNPSSGGATVWLALPDGPGLPARVAVHNCRGQLVRTLLDAPLATGAREIRWDGRDRSGAAVASGVYWCSLVYGQHREATQFVVVR